MNTVYFSIGSNQGNRLDFLQTAIFEINKRVGDVIAISSVYESEPLGFDSDELFLNACCSVKTSKEPIDILRIINTIESETGRVRTNLERYESRPLDIDIVLIDALILQTEELTIPHPRFRERLFVLRPLSDLAKTMVDPETKLTIEHLMKSSSDKSVLNKYELSLFI